MAFCMVLVWVQEIQMKQQALEAFRETIAVFNEQITLSENCLKLSAPHDLLRLDISPAATYW